MILYRPHRWLKAIAWGLACAVLLAAPALALASEPPAAPLSTQSTSLSGMVRVYLSSLSSQTALTLTVDGSYSINGDTSRMLSRGGSVRVSFESGQLYATVNGSKQSMGTRFFLRRHQSSGMNGLKIAQSAAPNSWYTGDFEFAVINGRMYTIVHVFMEDYIRGVLPYEMGSSFPLEALKAQAVAARTYTVQAMNRRAAHYDVVDTTADQVYRGLTTSSDRYEQAATATAGVVAMYNGQFVGGYYSASNGGQTEAVKNAWGNSSFPYLGVKDDPYDLANPSSVVRSFIVYGNGSALGPLDSLLKSRVASRFTAQGASTPASEVRIHGISNVTAHTPMYPAPSRLYTKVDFTVSASPSAGASASTMTVTFDFFSELESLLGLSINTTRNELLTVEPSGGNFILKTRRYGHGIGMSQRGAQQMANQGMTYRQILGFYYPGCNLVQYSFSNNLPSSPGTDTPQATPPPQQPQQPIDDSQSAATVTLSNPASWLNLRQSPSTGAAILAQLRHGQQVKVLSSDGVWCQVQYGGLTGYVMRDYLTFTQTAPPTTGPEPSNTPEPGNTPQPGPGTATVYLLDPKSRLNFRASASSSGRIIATIPHGAVVEIVSYAADWCAAKYLGLTGFLSTPYLRIQGDAGTPTATPGPVPSPGATAPPASGSELVVIPSTLNLRASPSTSARLLATLPSGARLTQLEELSGWYKVRWITMEGYVSAAFVQPVGATSPSPSAPAPSPGTAPPAPSGSPSPQPTPAPTAPPPGEKPVNTGLVAPKDNQLFAPGYIHWQNNAAAVKIPAGRKIDVLAYAGKDAEWCEILFFGERYFVRTEDLTLEYAVEYD